MELLDVPTICFGNNKIKLERGRPDFQSAPRNNSINNPYDLNDWLIISKDNHVIDQLMAHIRKASSGLGIKIGKASEAVVRGKSGEDWKYTLEKSLSERHKFVLAVLPSKNKDIYKNVKNFCLSQGKPCQCVVENNITGKRGLSIITNVVLQMSSKLGKEISNVDEIYKILPSLSMVCAVYK